MFLACSSEGDLTPDTGETPPADDVLSPEELTVVLDFTTGWPFNEPCAEASAQAKEGEPYTYTYKYGDGDSQTMTLDFMISHGTVQTSIDYSYSDGALRFNSTGGNNGEMKLPGIEGYYLNKVEARHISADKSRFALKDYFIAKTETLTERLLAGWATTGALTVFWMPVTEGLAQKQQPGQSFTLEMRDKNMAVSEIKLVYTKTKPVGEPPLDLSGKHLYAHRGKWSKSGSDYFIPENSLTGIQMAAMMGYEGIECDVKYTKDKVMVVMHDATINKSMRNADYTEISGDVKVADLTFEELRNNYVLESTEPAFRQPCPTLEEMLHECKRCGMRPMLHSSIYESYELAQEIMGDNWVCFTGSNLADVQKVRSELKSNCTILWSISSGFDTIETTLEKIGGDCGISSMESGYYTPEMINRLRDKGYHVQCSIFPSGEERLAIENGVDYILSDNVIPEGARTDITAEEILSAYPPPPPAQDELPEEFSIVLNFADGCPFVEGEFVAPESQDPTNGESYTYRYSDGDITEDFVFKFYARKAESTYHLYKDENGEVIGLYAGDLIEPNRCSLQILTPSIKNRYLTKVSYTASKAAGASNARMVLTDALNGGNITAAGANLIQTWTFPYTSSENKTIESTAGKSYVVRSRDSKNIIVSLTLTYSKTK